MSGAVSRESDEGGLVAGVVGLVELVRGRSRADVEMAVPERFLLLDAALRKPSRVAFVTRVRAASWRSTPSHAQQPRIIAVAKVPGHPDPERIAVGRSHSCDMLLRDPSVSKLHAHFCVAGAALTLVDVGSHNGTRVNGRRLLRDRPMALVPGDHVAFGDVAARLLDAEMLHELLRRQ